MLKQILCAALCALMLAFVPGGADAAPEIIEADGVYMMGDNDTPKSARDAARNEAMRAATEQAGVYIESTSEVQGYALTRDEIRTVAAAILRVLRGTVNLSEVRAELAAQLQRVEAAGIHPTHADSHQHMHVLPGVIDIALDLCKEAQIPAMRAPRAPLFAGDFGGIGQLIGRAGLSVLAHRAAAKAKARGIHVPDHFAGIVAGEAVDTEALTEIAAGLREGVTEVMLHPGTDNAVLIRDCLWNHDFEAEFAAVCAPTVRDALAAAGAEITNFRTFADSSVGYV